MAQALSLSDPRSLLVPILAFVVGAGGATATYAEGEQIPFYERLYGERAYPPRKVEQRVREAVASASKEQRFRRGRTLRPNPPAVQLTLI